MSVYALIDPRSGKVRYVGRSLSPYRRLKQHGFGKPASLVRKWIDQLKRHRLAPELKILGAGTEAAWVTRLRPDLNIKPGDTYARAEMTPGSQNATVSVKLSFTPSEMALFEEIEAELDGDRLTTWIRKVSIRAARERLARERAVLAEKKGGRR